MREHENTLWSLIQVAAKIPLCLYNIRQPGRLYPEGLCLSLLLYPPHSGTQHGALHVYRPHEEAKFLFTLFFFNSSTPVFLFNLILISKASLLTNPIASSLEKMFSKIHFFRQNIFKKFSTFCSFSKRKRRAHFLRSIQDILSASPRA